MALGAQRAQVVRLFFREGALLVAMGLGAGILAAIAIGRLLGTLLFGVTPADPIAALATLAILITAGLGATCIPALRASKVDPVQVLRSE
jgi:ABC-type antimicrobial peptide transport system permease subunit